MSGGLLIVIVIIAIVIFAAAAALFGLPVAGTGVRPRTSNVRSNMRNIVNSQREGVGSGNPRQNPRQSTIYETAAKEAVDRSTSSKLTLVKKIKYAQWKIPPIFYNMSIVIISLVTFGIISLKFDLPLRIAALFAGPVVMNWLITRGIERRYKAFDADYPQFLLSLVGLLKTGMNTMPAIEAAAAALDEGSLLKQEVMLMNDRLRFGVAEEKSIGSFGEDIYHPEIELFVQALLLSRRVGGTLSDTLDRLAKQVRRRQYFRQSAIAAVGMQRGSIWFIIAILVALEGYMYFVYPEAVIGAWADPLGFTVWQAGCLFIIGGMYWVRQVTKIKI